MWGKEEQKWKIEQTKMWNKNSNRIKKWKERINQGEIKRKITNKHEQAKTK